VNGSYRWNVFKGGAADLHAAQNSRSWYRCQPTFRRLGLYLTGRFEALDGCG
jgi:hypothetical protein